MEFGLIKPLSPSETKRLRPLESKEQTIMKNISNLFMLLMGGEGWNLSKIENNIFLPPNNLLFVSHGLVFPIRLLVAGERQTEIQHCANDDVLC